jgi:glyoxylate reductase
MLGSELRGKQLGLVGVGRIGRAVVARAAAFGMRVAYTSRRPIDLPDAEAMSLDRLLNTSDVGGRSICRMPKRCRSTGC